MAEAFKGLTVKVTLKNPTFEVQGVFEDIQDGTLKLKDVTILSSGQKVPEFEAKGANIADLAVAPSQPKPDPYTIPLKSQPTNVYAQQRAAPNKTEPPRPHPLEKTRSQSSFSLLPASIAPPRKSQPFVDPAILSYGKPPSNSKSERLDSLRNIQSRPGVVNENAQPELQAFKIVSGGPDPTSQDRAHQVSVNERTESLPVTLDPAIEALGSTVITNAKESKVPREQVWDQPQEEDNEFRAKKKRNRRGRRTRTKKNEQGIGDNGNDEQQSSPEMARSQTAQDGWRQTPIIQEASHPTSVAKEQRIPGIIGGIAGQRAAKSVKQKGRAQQRAFQKEARNGWATEDATDIQEMGEFDFEGNLSKFDKHAVFEQLRHEDSTADEERLVAFNRKSKNRNLHHTENVLSPTHESDEDAGFANSKHIKSSLEPSRGNRSLSRTKYASSHTTASSRLPDVASPTLPNSTTLRYEATGDPCPSLESSELAIIEGLAVSEHVLSEDILDENAAQAIAATAIGLVNTHLRRPSSGKLSSRALAVFIVGDQKLGARALAAGRHLAERGVQTLAILKDWKAGDLTHYIALRPRIGRQVRRFPGKVFGWVEASKHLKSLDAPPDLIIDALIGYSSFQSQTDKTSLEIAGWANRSRASVLAIDIPSGVHPESGNVDIVEGEFAEVRASTVVCCGAPLTGLVKAMEMRLNDNVALPWTVYVCDIGINRAWKKLGKAGANSTRRKPAVAFGSEWKVSVTCSPNHERGRQQ